MEILTCRKTFVENAKYGMTIQFNRAVDSKFMWAKESKINGTDVVSFTLTAPMGRSSSVLETVWIFWRMVMPF